MPVDPNVPVMVAFRAWLERGDGQNARQYEDAGTLWGAFYAGWKARAGDDSSTG